MMDKNSSILTELDAINWDDKSADRFRVAMRAVLLWNENKNIVLRNDDYTPEIMKRFIISQVDSYATSKMRSFKHFFLRRMEELHDHMRNHDAEKAYPYLYDSKSSISDMDRCFIRLADLSAAYEKDAKLYADVFAQEILSFMDFYYHYGQCYREEIEPAFLREQARLNREHEPKE